MRFVVPAILALILLASVTAWRTTHPAPAKAPANPEADRSIALSGPTMGSFWIVRLPKLPPTITAESLQSTIQSILDRVEAQMSTYRKDSDLSRFNQSRSTDWFPVPDDVVRVAEESRLASEQTGGAFDVTVGPLVNLWGFGPDHSAGTFGIIPSPALLEEARKHVNYRLLETRSSPPAMRKSDPLVYADFNGIAKGYAADLVGKKLDELGIQDSLVAVGGEMRARGVSHLGRPWRVGIQTPTPGTRRVLFEVELRDRSFSTSGDYENFFDKEGRRYSHEIDPVTGQPVAQAPSSASVADASGAHADAMATGMMVLGADRGYALACKLHLAVLFITREKDRFHARATPEFKSLLIPGDVPIDP